jgi:tetratricopeptide repeat protein/trypsin-like peptidase
MMADQDLVANLKDALENGDERATDAAVSSIIIAIEKDDPVFGDDDITVVNNQLRDHQQHEYMKVFGEALTADDRSTFETDKHYAQALIDTGEPKKALSLLRSMAKDGDSRDNFEHYSEAMGLIGRVHKDLYLEASEQDLDAAEKHLTRSLNAYGEPWKRSSSQCNWHAVNLLALSSNATVKGFKLPDDFDETGVANGVVSTIQEIPENDRNYWDWASLAEANVAKQDWASASFALVKALDAPGAQPFHLNGTLRQFKELWNLQDRSEKSAILVTWLERFLIAQPNSELLLDTDDIDRQQSVKESDLEALHSHHRMRSFDWLQKFLQRGESVASVVDINTGEPKGTCCLIDGSQISPDLKGRQYCLTNDHVLSNYPEQYSNDRRPLKPEQAAVRFTQSQVPDKKYAISSIVWSSPFSVHDTCLFALEEKPPLKRSTLPIVSYVPEVNPEKPQEIFIISHPEKEALSFSFQNTDLVDHDAEAKGKNSLTPGLLHYTTPTISGSSGGVALNAQLEMVGLHHAGGSEITMLNGKDGTYAVNEAIWIQPILNAILSDIQEGRDRWVIT